VPSVCVLSSEGRPVFKPCAGVHWVAYSLGTVSPATRIKPPEFEAHHTSTSLPIFYINAMYPLIHLPSRPVHASHNSSLFHYCISLATVCTCSDIRNNKMQPVYTDTFLVPLPHTAISHFNVDTIFSVNVLSVGSSNNTDEWHTNRTLTVSRHCAGHHCPSVLWKLQFPGVFHYWTFGATVRNCVFKLSFPVTHCSKITDRIPNFE